MNLFLCLIFVLASTIDVFILGISYGLKKVHLGLFSNGLIALLSGIGTFLSMLFAQQFHEWISPFQASLISSAILLILAFKMIFELIKNKLGSPSLLHKIQEDPNIVDFNKTSTFEFFEILVLGFMLAINNIGLGIGASLAQLDLFMMASLSVVASFIFMSIGLKLGNICLRTWFYNVAEILSIFLLFLLAILVVIF